MKNIPVSLGLMTLSFLLIGCVEEHPIEKTPFIEETTSIRTLPITIEPYGEYRENLGYFIGGETVYWEWVSTETGDIIGSNVKFSIIDERGVELYSIYNFQDKNKIFISQERGTLFLIVKNPSDKYIEFRFKVWYK